MCTIVTLLKPNPKDDLLVLYNRDRPIEGYEGNDMRVINGDLLALYDYRSKGIAWGYALNSGLYGAVANVLSYAGPKSRGALILKVMSETETLDEALRLAEDELARGEYRSGVYMFGDKSKVYTIENYRTKTIAYSQGTRSILTNQYERMNFASKPSGSEARRLFVKEYLEAAAEVTLKDFIRIGTHHGENNRICRHDATVGSVIMELAVDATKPTVYYSLGPPCKGYFIFNVSTD